MFHIPSFLLILGLLAACGRADAPQAASADTYGAELQLSETTSLQDLNADRERWVGQTLQVEGTVVGVCEKRGCWIEIGDDQGQSLRFKVEDGEMVFPVSAKGSHVRAEGVWTKIVIPIEELRERRAAQAEAAGEEFDPASVTEPYVAWQLQGLGAVIDS